MLAQHGQDHDRLLPQLKKVPQGRKGLVHLPPPQGVGHLKDLRVDYGDGHRVDVLPGHPAVFRKGPDLADLGNEAVHQVSAEEDEVLGVRRVDLMPQGPEPAADPVDQVSLLLAGKLDHLALFLDGPRQLSHASVALVGHRVVDKDQAAILRQVRQDLRHGRALSLRGLEQVVVVDHDQGPGAHHGQGVHRLPQALGGQALAGEQMIVEALHAAGDELGLHLVQIVVPEIGLLPVENIQGADGPLGQVFLELPIDRLGGGLVVSFRCHFRMSPLPGRRW